MASKDDDFIFEKDAGKPKPKSGSAAHRQQKQLWVRIYDATLFVLEGLAKEFQASLEPKLLLNGLKTGKALANIFMRRPGKITANQGRRISELHGLLTQLEI